ncbi:MAG: DUF4011 domain-containing protein, partial [Acidobacteria bacterium]|nr:DUF4011 domain-containing protein [Acidobacteriota bacterium]
GQPRRLPERTRQAGVPPCLDTSLLMAALFEQAKLNAVVALPESHALVGVWLTDQTFAGPFTKDPGALRKRADLDDLLLIETTLATGDPAPPFSDALKAGRRALDHTGDAKYTGTVDIRRAREQQIRPLAVEIETPRARAAESSGTGRPGPEQPPTALLQAGPQDTDEATETPGRPAPGETADGRVDRWLRQLLDLSLRNPLLNHRETSATIPIHCPDPGLLEDKLAAGKRMRLDPGVEHALDQTLLKRDDAAGRAEEAARGSLAKNRLTTDLDKDQLDKRSVELYRRTRTALEEGGANTLYLVLGFLRWRREPDKGRHLRAPLVLIPVTLERTSARARMYIARHDDEPRFNTTLLEMLHRDYRLDVKGLDGPLPTDDHGVHVAEIWNRVRRATLDTPGFEVVENVTLSNVSFAKHLMWSDLRDRRDLLRKSPVVAKLLDTDLSGADGGADDEAADLAPYDAGLYGGAGRPPVPAREIDARYAPAELLTPLPADGSQTAAVADAHEGRSFVLVGPPGTGKSQTIGNLIAHGLGTGKTVLFASEKTAALNVVHKRLEEIGLDAHCLALHSNKARKTDVIAQLDRAWNPLPGALPPPRPRRGRPPAARPDAPAPADKPAPSRHQQDRHPDETPGTAEPAPSPVGAAVADDAWHRESDELAELRTRLNEVPERLHRRWPNGLTPFEAIGLKGRHPALAEAVKLQWPAPDGHTADDRRKLLEAAKRLGQQAGAAAEAGIGPSAPVRRVPSDRLPPSPDQLLRETSDTVLRAAEKRLEAGRVFRRATRLDRTPTATGRAAGAEAAEYALAQAVRIITDTRETSSACDAAEPWIGRITEPGTVELLSVLTKAAEEIRDTTETLSAPYAHDAWRRIDGNRISAAHWAARTRWWPARALAERRLRQLLVQEGGLPPGTVPDIRNDARALARLQSVHERIESIRQKLPCELPSWTPGQASPRSIAALADQARELHRAMADDRLYDSPAGTPERHEETERVAAWVTLATERRREQHPQSTAAREVANGLVEAHEELIDSAQALATVMEPPAHAPNGPATGAGGLPLGASAAETAGSANALREAIPKLKTWRGDQRRRNEAGGAGPGPPVDAVDAGPVRPNDAAHARP